MFWPQCSCTHYPVLRIPVFEVTATNNYRCLMWLTATRLPGTKLNHVMYRCVWALTFCRRIQYSPTLGELFFQAVRSVVTPTVTRVSRELNKFCLLLPFVGHQTSRESVRSSFVRIERSYSGPRFRDAVNPRRVFAYHPHHSPDLSSTYVRRRCRTPV